LEFCQAAEGPLPGLGLEVTEDGGGDDLAGIGGDCEFFDAVPQPGYLVFEGGVALLSIGFFCVVFGGGFFVARGDFFLFGFEVSYFADGAQNGAGGDVLEGLVET